MSKSKIREVTQELKRPVLRTEGWFMKIVHLNKPTTVFAEFLASFILLFFTVMPIAMTTGAEIDGGAFSSGWDYITEVNIIRVLYLATLAWIGYLFFRKFRLAVNPLNLAYKYGTKEVKTMEALVRWGAAIAGGLLATYLATLMSQHAGTFVYTDMEAGIHGSAIGAVQPMMRGWGVSWGAGSGWYDGEYWWYVVRFFVELAMLSFSMFALLYFRNHPFRKNVFWRYLWWIITIGIFLKFAAHTPNWNRWLVGTSVMQFMGGYANWELFGFVTAAHVIAWSALIWGIRSHHVPWLK